MVTGDEYLNIILTSAPALIVFWLLVHNMWTRPPMLTPGLSFCYNGLKSLWNDEPKSTFFHESQYSSHSNTINSTNLQSLLFPNFFLKKSPFQISPNLGFKYIYNQKQSLYGSSPFQLPEHSLGKLSDPRRQMCTHRCAYCPQET